MAFPETYYRSGRHFVRRPVGGPDEACNSGEFARENIKHVYGLEKDPGSRLFSPEFYSGLISKGNMYLLVHEPGEEMSISELLDEYGCMNLEEKPRLVSIRIGGQAKNGRQVYSILNQEDLVELDKALVENILMAFERVRPNREDLGKLIYSE